MILTFYSTDYQMLFLTYNQMFNPYTPCAILINTWRYNENKGKGKFL